MDDERRASEDEDGRRATGDSGEAGEEPGGGDEPNGAPEGDEARDPDAEGGRRLSRRKLTLILAPIIVVVAVGTIASALTPTLAAKHPLLLIILEARNRNLILARRVDFVPFLLAAVFRRTLTDPLFYLLGYHYGDGAVRWLEVKAGLGSYARLMERIFKKAAYPAVFLFPGAIVCAMAGVIRMRFAVFFALNLAGTVAAVIALKLTGDAFASPVESLIAFFDRNLLVTTIVSISLVILSVVLGRAEAKMSMKGAQDELERAAAEEEAKGADGSEG